jgi:hypothetical protein
MCIFFSIPELCYFVYTPPPPPPPSHVSDITAEII